MRNQAAKFQRTGSALVASLHARHTGSAEAPFVCTLAISVQPPPSIGRPLLVTKEGISLLGSSWPPNSSLG